MAEFSGVPSATGRRFAIIASRFTEDISNKLLNGAMDALTRHGAAFENVDVIWVPGAWEIPPAARRLMLSERYDALVALGAVIRGETSHYDYVAGECSRGLADASSEFDVPVGFGVLTCENFEQAEARSGGSHGNKGWDAAIAAMEMADLFARLDAAQEE
jgi:6,7-dimethyl-8-ribityllumazine synthase